MIIDFHTHVFPEKIAEKTIEKLSFVSGGLIPQTNGTLIGLKDLMKTDGVDKSVVLAIATNEKQQTAVNDYIKSCESEDIIPFGSVYPHAENALEEESSFAADLSSEEINILAILMMVGWTQRQITSIENTRMKYSGTDFKMTSQANHLAKLLSLLKEVQRQSHHMQRLYKRRKIVDGGQYESNWSVLRTNSAIDY